ncbi:MAG: hypothetical protein JW759_07810 [Candidatus Coatesbacteria bacterium]|nr:hypothetical protein [Candidatus Coatesbacteria bacterium]
MAAIRTIEVDHHDLDCVETAKAEIARQVRSMEQTGAEIDSPISGAVDLEVLRQSGNPEQRQLADVLAALVELRSGLSVVEKKLTDPTALLPAGYLRDTIGQDLRSCVGELTERVRPFRPRPGILEDLAMSFDRLAVALGPSEGGDPGKAKLEEARELLHRSYRALHILAMESGMPRGVYEELLERELRRRKPEQYAGTSSP